MSCEESNSRENACGIDVSRWQGNIDWARVAGAGITHAIAKMTEGGDYTDPTFVENFQGMKANGLKAGVYHYFRALSSTPCEQLANIKARLAEVDFKLGQDILAIDVETHRNESATADQMADALFQLVTLVRVSLLEGAYPHIYASPNIWNNRVAWHTYDFSECPLWIANWNVTEPTVPQTWNKQGKSWRWWQHSSKGQVDGIQGAVDLNWVRL
ncbi:MULTISPECIES: glycoside hydrolase family 25 protein [Pseudomonas]|jgi:lysozyme|uniref:glycoside hydrolase family 25 protein n=1 Tax=Pseudomonas TaxID=286 RepID=UPI001AE898E9|nr:MULTISPECIES: glycoside hydrolase family 25 protein [unclassified Pseudomonas]WQG58176.1 glycoside hydrolase family 25 protein [Pseudomonas sp. RTB3]MBP1123999.1 lysozyme [Pseudomonas sp. PvP025]MDQ0397859.1 lysozyme [Pseudomonas sp. PvP006]MEB0106415.1 glycoside hydrolase family 25 protein [Pseudomonas sp. MH9.3]WPX79715.1 glycoside hydrolase family 25 protein [Pseudomonas sp. MH9.3]